ncbi:MAG TPA: SDR family NAD(P)-dependent oxidoreductase [bacterium]|nr:SDR family NAD(P)-dependent oxidoreductase [bacterium]
MDLGLRDKVAVVTGGSDGLGRAVVERFVAEGASVAMCARRADRLRAVADPLRGRGGQILDVRADVSRPDDIARFIAATQERFGRIDVLVNNAGTSAAHPFEAGTTRRGGPTST